MPPRNPTRLAEALSDLLADPQRRATLGAAGIIRARSRYGWEEWLGPHWRPTLKLAPTPNGPRSGREGDAQVRDAAILPAGQDHVEALVEVLATLGPEVERVDTWGRHLADVLMEGGCLRSETVAARRTQSACHRIPLLSLARY